MSEDCEHVQSVLTDGAFDGAALDQAMEQHLADCPECAAHAAQLRRIQAALDGFSPENEVNEAQIHKAFLLAAAARQKQQGRYEVPLFILAAIFVLLLAYGLCALINTDLILYVQGFLYLLTPVLLIPLMRKGAFRAAEKEAW